MDSEQLTGQLSKPFLVYDTQQSQYTITIQIGVIEEVHLGQRPVSVYGGGYLELGTPYMAAL